MGVTWDKFTPAVYGIITGLAPTIIEARWTDLIVPILRHEEDIYACAFQSFAIVQSRGRVDREWGFQVFKTLLEGVNQQIQSQDSEKVLRYIFHEYWHLALSESYWRPGKFPQFGQHVLYNDAVARWEQDYHPYIQRSQEVFKGWIRN